MATPKKASGAAKKPAAAKKTAAKKAPAKKTPAKKTTTKKAATLEPAAAKVTPAKVPAKKAADAPVTEKVPERIAAAVPASPAVAPVASADSEERVKMIETAAYFIAERNGFGDDHLAYWLEAEAQIDAQIETERDPVTA